MVGSKRVTCKQKILKIFAKIENLLYERRKVYINFVNWIFSLLL